jgi:hypothetical protein
MLFFIFAKISCVFLKRRHHYLWHDSHSLPWIFLTTEFYGVVLSTPRPTLSLENQASVFVTAGDRVAQSYPQALGTHFNRLLRHA